MLKQAHKIIIYLYNCHLRNKLNNIYFKMMMLHSKISALSFKQSSFKQISYKTTTELHIVHLCIVLVSYKDNYCQEVKIQMHNCKPMIIISNNQLHCQYIIHYQHILLAFQSDIFINTIMLILNYQLLVSHTKYIHLLLQCIPSINYRRKSKIYIRLSFIHINHQHNYKVLVQNYIY